MEIMMEKQIMELIRLNQAAENTTKPEGARKKAGIIRCRQTEDMCPGTTDFKIAEAGTSAFAETGPVEIVGFVNCGGCPGKRAVRRAEEMVRHGAEIIVLASCIFKGSPIGFPCPNAHSIRDAIAKKLPDIPLVEWTH